jgi:predicted regulator of Ras-like GTPase activity (Roadblock/LC7/MglB family)
MKICPADDSWPSLISFLIFRSKVYNNSQTHLAGQVGQMAEIAQFDKVVERLLRTEHTRSVFVTSRAGVFIYGETPEMTDQRVYSAITSMMLGAADQMANEMDEILDFVLLRMSERDLIVLGAGPKHLLGILTDLNADPHRIAQEARTILTETLV